MNRSSISISTKRVSQTIHTGKPINHEAGDGKFEPCRKIGGTHRRQRSIYRQSSEHHCAERKRERLITGMRG
ncbi:hypothetical protein SESBI_29043 [Sesbania bispinosa]|nr:hypothetical protein SESBI_29043 [Sesbania bispinosa]